VTTLVVKWEMSVCMAHVMWQCGSRFYLAPRLVATLKMRFKMFVCNIPFTFLFYIVNDTSGGDGGGWKWIHYAHKAVMYMPPLKFLMILFNRFFCVYWFKAYSRIVHNACKVILKCAK